MKNFNALIFAILVMASTVAAQNAAISWEKDFKKALAAARQSGKPVLLFFTAPDCEACKEMEKQYWADEAVAGTARQFVAVRASLDTEKPLAAKFNVTEIPFVAFTDPLGNLISFQRGFTETAPRRLNLALKETPKDFSRLKRAYQAVEREKDDGGALLEIADAYRSSNILFLSSEFYKKAAKTPEVSGNSEIKERVGFALGINAVGYRDYKQAVDYLEDYLKNYPQGDYRETALTLLVVGNANLEKLKESEKYLARLKAEFPDSKNVNVAAKAVENAKAKRGK